MNERDTDTGHRIIAITTQRTYRVGEKLHNINGDMVPLLSYPRRVRCRKPF